MGGNKRYANITDNKDYVFGTGFTVSENLIGEEIGCAINGPGINFHVTGIISRAVIDDE